MNIFYEAHWNSYHWPLYGFALSDITLKKLYRDTALKILNKKRQCNKSSQVIIICKLDYHHGKNTISVADRFVTILNISDES